MAQNVSSTNGATPVITLVVVEEDKEKAKTPPVLVASTDVPTLPATAFPLNRTPAVRLVSPSPVVSNIPKQIVRPNWISDAEVQWFDKTGGLDPVAESVDGTVTIKLRKPNLSKEAFLKASDNYDVWERTANVEMSFKGTLDGKTYTFTGTNASGHFVPVVAECTVVSDNDKIVLGWTQADPVTAAKFIRAHRSLIEILIKKANIMRGTLFRSQPSVDDYIDEIIDHLGSVKNGKGFQEYDLRTGYFIHQQHLEFTNPIISAIVRSSFAQGALKAGALKAAYVTIGEFALAGPRGSAGTAVQTYQGGEIQTGP